MTFSDWQQLPASAAARELHRRVETLLPPSQQRAVFAHLPDEAELEQAFASADRRAPLGGVPYLIKDLFDVRGWPTRASSIFLADIRPTPDVDATIVTKLRARGAVLAGKTHLHEFAYGITGENPHYGDCEHPHFPGRTSGGSSSGSAAAVAAGIVPFAIGTDTGGSVRVPAAFCGLYGLRLSPDNPLGADAFPLAPTFDTIGWFTNNAPDLLTTLRALTEPAAAVATPRGCYLELPGLEPEVAQACRRAAASLAPHADASLTAELRAGFQPSVDAYNQIVAAEAWAIHRPWAERHRSCYDPAVWQRLQRGVTQTAADLGAARAQLHATRELWARYFDEHDFMVMPATPFGAPTKAECDLAHRNRLLALTAPASLGGLPVLTIPVPLPSGLTTGLQVIVPDAKSSVLTWVLEQP